MINKSLKATVREDIGSNTTKKVRKEFLIPGVVYRKGEGTRSITVDALEFNKLFKQVGTSAILDLEVEGEVIPAIVKSVQRDPVKGQIIHIDLQKLDMQQRIKLEVPISLLHRDKIVLQPSVLMQMLDSVEIECLPGNIPESIGVDVSGMDFTTPLYVKDLEIMKDEMISVLTDPEAIICSLNKPTVVVDEDEVTPEAEAEEASPEDEEKE